MSRSPSVGRAIAGGALIILGALFLLGQFVRVDFWHYVWPLIIIGVGVAFLVGMWSGDRSVSGLAIPGSIVTMVGLILLFQNTFGYWETWSYAWALIVVAVGVGIYLMGLRAGQDETKRGGATVAVIGGVLFLAFGAFFELIFRGGRGVVWPVLLIAAGVYLLVRYSRR